MDSTPRFLHEVAGWLAQQVVRADQHAAQVCAAATGLLFDEIRMGEPLTLDAVAALHQRLSLHSTVLTERWLAPALVKNVRVVKLR